MSNTQTLPLIGMLYKQATGGIYVVRCFAESEETGEKIVCYSSVRNGKVFYRTLESFFQIGRKSGKPRFELVIPSDS